MDIAYLQHSIISEDMFYTLMFTAFALNIEVPLSIRQWQPGFMPSVDRVNTGQD